MRREPFPFWRYSVRTYGLPGVAAACLALQDECGADVNVLLYCCWMGRLGHRLDRRALRSATAAVARWQAEVVRPLRLARRAIRKDARGSAGRRATALRRRISAAELDAEYVEQMLLAAVSERYPRRSGAGGSRERAAANLRAYFALLGAPAAPRHVATLLAAEEQGSRRHPTTVSIGGATP